MRAVLVNDSPSNSFRGPHSSARRARTVGGIVMPTALERSMVNYGTVLTSLANRSRGSRRTPRGQLERTFERTQTQTPRLFATNLSRRAFDNPRDDCFWPLACLLFVRWQSGYDGGEAKMSTIENTGGRGQCVRPVLAGIHDQDGQQKLHSFGSYGRRASRGLPFETREIYPGANA